MDDEPVAEFVCHPDDEGKIPKPKPGSRILPDWYKHLSATFEVDRLPARTIRMCPAFLDALSLGWVLPFEADVKVNTEGAEVIELDDSGADIVSDGEFGELPDDAVAMVQFHSSWAVKLPEGYSLLVLQPMNRSEKRYEIVGQVLDADDGLTRIDVPAIWYADGARTIIRQGDPLAQVVPIDRGSRLDRALARPFREEGLRSIDATKGRSHVNRSWYREKEWEPKGTRVIG